MPLSKQSSNSRPSTWALLALLCLLLQGCSSNLQLWHSRMLSGEYEAGLADEVDTLEHYLQLEEALFQQLDQKIYARTPTGMEYALNRYSSGSAADPRGREPDWNRSFSLQPQDPVGGVLLLHGMSDSPYSLRSLGESLYERGYYVLGLRLPGHGTIPSGMTQVHWRDMAAATALGMRHLRAELDGQPIHVIGYSTGAALALDYALEAEPAAQPESLVLISPAIAVSGAAAFASWMRGVSRVPGLNNLAWTQVEPEFDPYKYNSFATNAAEQVHLATRSVGNRLRRNVAAGEPPALPPMLVLKSTVDATVSTEAVVDNLLGLLPPAGHELLLFDINRHAALSALLLTEQGAFTERLLGDPALPFALTLVANTSADSRAVEAAHKPPRSADFSRREDLQAEWPAGVVSLSHVALPFAPDDPLYGRYPPEDRGALFLGTQSLQGERGLLKISPNYLMRLRYNPFYDYMERRVIDWLSRGGT